VAGLAGLDRTPAIHRSAQRVHHPAQHRRTDRHFEQVAGAPHRVAFLEFEVVAHDGGADVVLFQVEHHPGHRLARLLGGELEHLVRNRGLEPVDAGDAVANLQHRAHLGHVGGAEIGGRDFPEQDVLQLARTEDGVSGHEVRRPG
jgi:hypothetical protein